MNDEDESIKLEKIAELMKPVDEQITSCQSGNEQIMLACGMMQRVKEILEHHLGLEESKKLLENYIYDQHVH